MDGYTPLPPNDADRQAPPPAWQLWRSPGAYLLDGQEFVRLTVAASVAGVTIKAIVRTINPAGRVTRTQLEIAPSSTRATSTVLRAVGDGAIIDATIRVTAGTPLYGQAAAVLDIVQSNSGEQQPTGTLVGGYVTVSNPLFAPGAMQTAFVDGPGAVRVVVGSVPAAGADILETVPTGARWELVALTALLTTAVAVANRLVALTIDDGANVYFKDSPNFVQTASLTDTYSFADGQNKLATPSATAVVGNLPADGRLLAGHRIRTSTALIQAADQWTAPIYLVREWLEL